MGRRPAEGPSHESALAGVAFESIDEGGGGGSMIGIEGGDGMLIPIGEVLGGPREGFVEVTEVAGVGASGLDGGEGAGAIDLVASDGFEQTVGGVGHVAIVTEAAAGAWGVAGMAGEVIADGLMALEAGEIAVHGGSELIIWIAVVHGVAGEAGELAALETGGIDEAVVFASGDADHAIGPIAIAEEGGFLLEGGFEPGLIFEAGGLNDGFGFGEVLAWAEAETVLEMVLAVGDPFDAVALAADFGGSFVVEFGWVDDGRVGLLGEVLGVTSGEVAEFGDVIVGGPVAGFARDAEFGGLGFERARLVVWAGLSGGDVAVDAIEVPALFDEGDGGVAEESVMEGNPFLIFDEPGEGEEGLQIALGAGEPIDLHVVGAREKAQAAFDAAGWGGRIGLGWWRGGVGIVHFDPEFLAAALEEVSLAQQFEAGVIKVSEHGVLGGALGHGAVEGPAPGVVFAGVTRAAMIGRDVAVGAAVLGGGIEQLSSGGLRRGGEGVPKDGGEERCGGDDGEEGEGGEGSRARGKEDPSDGDEGQAKEQPFGLHG